MWNIIKFHFIVGLFLLFILGIACLLTVTILEIPDLGVDYVAKPLDIIFSILIPNYSLGRAVSNLYQNNIFNKLCNIFYVKVACAMGVGEKFDLIKPCCKGNFSVLVMLSIFSF